MSLISENKKQCHLNQWAVKTRLDNENRVKNINYQSDGPPKLLALQMDSFSALNPGP